MEAFAPFLIVPIIVKLEKEDPQPQVLEAPDS
jgi:hypothetical protein